jgi:hypothetical protein
LEKELAKENKQIEEKLLTFRTSINNIAAKRYSITDFTKLSVFYLFIINGQKHRLY